MSLGKIVMEPLVSVIIPTYNRCKDAIECVRSVISSEYRNLEIIVVDNASTDNTTENLENLFKNNSILKVKRLQQNMMAAGGRNAGIQIAGGKYLLFLDSDNIIHPLMISALVEEMENNNQIGLLGPVMFYYKDKERLWFAGNKINYWTSQATYVTGEWDELATDLMKTDHIPNAFMTTKEIVDEIGGFDERYYIMYEEADFAARIRRKGYCVMVCGKAVTYHNIPLPEEVVENEMRKLGCDNPLRTFHFAKNRSLYMKKYAPWYGKVLYFCFFQFVFAGVYCVTAVKNKRLDICKSWICGMIVGMSMKP